MYRVARIAGAEPRFAAFIKIAADAAGDRPVANDLRSLRQAFEAVERFHSERSGRSVESNADASAGCGTRSGRSCSRRG
jgi:hypothetical protein